MRDEETTANLIGILMVALLCIVLIKCTSQQQEDCSRRKCATGTPTWMIREGKCLCVNLPE